MGIDPVTHTPRLDLLDLSSLLYASSSSSQLNNVNDLSSLQLGMHHPPLLNPHLLKLASSLLSSQRRDHINQNHSHHQNHNFCNPISDTSLFHEMPLPQAAQSMVQPNADPYISSNLIDFGDWQSNNGIASTTATTLTQDYIPEVVPSFQYYSSDQYHQNLMDPQNNYFGLASVRSTPSNSNSTYINGAGSSTEDERGNAK